MKDICSRKRIGSKTRKDLLIAASTLGLMVGAGMANQSAQADIGVPLSNAVLTSTQVSLAQVAVSSPSISSSTVEIVNTAQAAVTSSASAVTNSKVALNSTVNSLAGSLTSLLTGSNSSLGTQASSLLEGSLLAAQVNTTLASSTLTNGISAVGATGSIVNNDDLMKQFAGGAFQGITAHSLYMISHWVNQPYNYAPNDYLYKGQILTDNFGTINQSFEVLDYVDSQDPASGLPANGFEGAAFAPIVNGKADLSRIIVSYGALQADHTNTVEFKKDALTALETVMAGQNIYTDGGYTTEAQTVTAAKYTQKIMAEYPAADVMATGLSLAGYLALSTGARLEIPAFTWVGDDPTNSLTAEQNAFVHSHPSMFVNIRNAYDLILGAHGANGTNSARYFDGGFEGIVLGHYQFINDVAEPLEFNSDGSLSNTAAPVAGTLINDVVNLPDPLITGVANVLTRAMLDSVGTPVAPIATYLSSNITQMFNNLNFFQARTVDPNIEKLSTFFGGAISSAEGAINSVGSLIENSINSIVSGGIGLADLVGGVKSGVGTKEDPLTTNLETTPITAVSNAVINSGIMAQTSLSTTSQASGGAFAGITAHQFYVLSKSTYDPLRFMGQPSVHVGDIIYENQDQTGQAFQVLYTVDSSNPSDGYSDNGFAASSVAPIINGKPDISRIVVAISGSDNRPANGLSTDYAKDVLTDFETVVGGQNYYTDGTKVIQGQSSSAERFVQTVKATFPNSQVVITGISLGGYLALSSGAQTKSPVFSFEGDDPSNILTPEQLAYVHAHPSMYINNRNIYDLFFGGFNGDGMNAARYWDGGFEGLFGSHYQSIGDVTEDPYKFNPDGSIADPVGPTMGALLNSIVTAPDGILGGIGSIIAKGIAESSNSQLLSPIVSGAVSAAESVVATLHPLVIAANGPEAAVGKAIGAVIDSGEAVKNTVVNAGGAALYSLEDTLIAGAGNILSFFGVKA